MSYLLDKVTARFIVGATIKLDGGEALSSGEKLALDFFTNALSSHQRLFIVPATNNILQRLARNPRYTDAIRHFLDSVEVVKATRYFKRWSRRLRGYNFTREDANVIALADPSRTQDKLLVPIRRTLSLAWSSS
jgi:hypothetical protein